MIQDRINALRDFLREKNLDGVIINKLENVFYFSGFTGDDTMLVVSAEDAALVTDFRYIEQATAEAPLFRIVKQEKGFIQKLAETISSMKINRIGFEGAALVWDWYGQIKNNLPDNALLESVNLNSLRQIKEKEEIECIRQAMSISDKAFDDILHFIRSGISENAVAARLENVMRSLGSQRPAFTTIVASGRRGSLPHGTATEKLINPGEFVTMDYGAVYKGYHSDMTRTVCVGKADAKQREVYDAVLEAQLLGVSLVKPGASCREVDGEVRRFLDRHGFAEYFGHGLGHSLGLEIHEAPSLSPRNEGTKLMANVLITVEPGVYIPDWGGVRIEDTVLVTDNGREILTSSPKELIEIPYSADF